MATKTDATPQKDELPEKEGPGTPPDSPLFDLTDAASQEADPGRQEARLRHP